MKAITLFFVCLFAGSCYCGENYKSVSLADAIINIPAKWNVSVKNDCLIIRSENVNASDYLKLCRTSSNGESDYFSLNDDGLWEAITEGIPVLAEVNVTSKFTGMSAIVSCKYKDDAGYHTDQCFQAEIKLPQKINFIFTGRGDSSLFKAYKSTYLSFKVK